MTRSYFEHFVFAVAIERRPLNVCGLAGPVKCGGFVSVSNFELPASVWQRQADDQRTELSGRSGGVEVRSEESFWTFVDLQDDGT